MLIGFSMPSVVGYNYATTLSGGGFIGSTQSALHDGLPARVARMQWPTSVGVIADHMRIVLLLSGGVSSLRVAAVRGLTLPVGTKLQLDFLNGHTGFTLVATQVQRAVRFADGSVGAWFLFPESTPAADRVDLVVYNDINGATAIAANQYFDIGEIVAMRCADIDIQEDWADESIDPTETTLTRDSQPASIGRLSYRKIDVNLSASAYAQVYGSGLAGGMDWAQLRAAFAGDAPVIAMPRWRDDSGAVSQGLINSTAVFGTARMGKVLHLGGDYYSAGVTFTESPAAS